VKSPPLSPLSITLLEEDESDTERQVNSGEMKTTRTTSDPPFLKQEPFPLTVDGALSEEESSILPFQADEHRESLSDGALEEVPLVEATRPKTARSVSSSIRRRLTKSPRPSVQFEKSVNPVWGWGRMKSSKSSVSNGSV
jgi:hypothetical protein